MQNLVRPLQTQRVIAIDAFRAITFLIMIFVNEIAGVQDISPWLKHMAADADAMSLPDVVFPAFLFIVGMSIPISINQRLLKGDRLLQLNQHILLRALGLIVMGVFMVNAESAYDQHRMLISIDVWRFLSYLGFAAIWGVFPAFSHQNTRLIKLIGISILVSLLFLYRSKEPGHFITEMQIQWWGILGLIGWAYLFASWIYQLCGAQQAKLLIGLILCTCIYLCLHAGLSSMPLVKTQLYQLFPGLDAHFAHTGIVLSGTLCSLIFFEQHPHKSAYQRFIIAFVFALGLIFAASILRPYFSISKIYATPSWCFYSAAVCILVFSILYWLIDIQQHKSWTKPILSVALNPLVCYLLPFLIGAILALAKLPTPVQQFSGTTGIIAAILYTGGIVCLVALINRSNFKIKF